MIISLMLAAQYPLTTAIAEDKSGGAKVTSIGPVLGGVSLTHTHAQATTKVAGSDQAPYPWRRLSNAAQGEMM